MRKFKVGDRVVCMRASFLHLSVGDVYTVYGYDRPGYIKLKELLEDKPLHNLNDANFELYVDERTEVEQAIDVFEKYDIYRTSSNRYRSYKLQGCDLNRNRDVFLRTAFPTEKQTKLQELQEQIAHLQKTANELEKEING